MTWGLGQPKPEGALHLTRIWLSGSRIQSRTSTREHGRGGGVGAPPLRPKTAHHQLPALSRFCSSALEEQALDPTAPATRSSSWPHAQLTHSYRKTTVSLRPRRSHQQRERRGSHQMEEGIATARGPGAGGQESRRGQGWGRGGLPAGPGLSGAGPRGWITDGDVPGCLPGFEGGGLLGSGFLCGF